MEETLVASRALQEDHTPLPSIAPETQMPQSLGVAWPQPVIHDRAVAEASLHQGLWLHQAPSLSSPALRNYVVFWRTREATVRQVPGGMDRTVLAAALLKLLAL